MTLGLSLASFVPNPGLEGELEQFTEVKHALKEKAERIVDVARSIAPVDTGAYRDSIHVEEGEHVQVVADVPYALYLEFGTSDTPTFATLRTAGESEGGLEAR